MKKKDYDKYYNDTKTNYINYFANLVASNINSLYRRSNNIHDYKYFQIINESENAFILNKEEIEALNNLIENILKEKYNLVFIDKSSVKLKKY